MRIRHGAVCTAAASWNRPKAPAGRSSPATHQVAQVQLNHQPPSGTHGGTFILHSALHLHSASCTAHRTAQRTAQRTTDLASTVLPQLRISPYTGSRAEPSRAGPLVISGGLGRAEYPLARRGVPNLPDLERERERRGEWLERVHRNQPGATRERKWRPSEHGGQESRACSVASISMHGAHGAHGAHRASGGHATRA